MKAELSNCKKCGKVFPKFSRDLCNECYELEKNQLETVKKHLETLSQDKNLSLEDISQATGVSVSDIQGFMKKRRLLALGDNVTLKCKMCGCEMTARSSSLLCSKCDNTVNDVIVEQSTKAESERGPLLKSDNDSNPSNKKSKYGFGRYDF